MAPTGQSPTFDKRSFVRYMKNIGRAYRKQAMELVSTCRTFVQVQEQTPASDAMLRSVLDVVDDALKSAAEEGTKTSVRVDENFEAAIKALDEYHVEYHPERSAPNLRGRMAEARENDESSSTILNRLKETFRPIEPQPKRIVEFLIHKSLPEKRPTSVKQVLCERSHLAEILWNFCRFKDKKGRLRLSQNPQFYEPLPKFTNHYGDRFLKVPTENFRVEKVDVLTDNPSGRVYLETARNRRAFGNVYSLNKVIIFKDVCGKLEGESVVGEAFQDPLNTGIWCFKEPPRSRTPPRTRSSDRSNPSPTTTAASTPSVEGVSIQDWRNPIREMLDSLKNGRNVDVNVRITTRPPSPGNTSHSYSAPSSPSPQLFSSSSDVSLSPIADSQSLPATSQTRIPEPSAGPPTTPSNYRTPRDKPLSGRSPVIGLPQSTPAPSAPNLPSALPPQPALIVAPPSPAVAPTSLPPQFLPAASQTRISEPSAEPPTTPSNYRTPRNTPLSGRSPVAGLPQSTPAPPAPNLLSASPPQPALIVASPSPAVAPTSLPPQQPSVVLPLTGGATPAPPTACSASEIREREFRRDTSPEAAPSSSREPIADVPPSGGKSRQPSIQPPKPYPEHVGGTSLKPGTAALPPPIPPQAVDPTPKRRKNWFQKYVYDYNNT